MFAKGNQLGKANAGKRKQSKKTVWIMESLAENGYDYERMLVSFLQKAAKGDRLALDMAHLLIKLVPHLANAPKHDVGVNQIETLVINRYEVSAPRVAPVETEAELQAQPHALHESDTVAVDAEEGQASTVTSIADTGLESNGPKDLI